MPRKMLVGNLVWHTDKCNEAYVSAHLSFLCRKSRPVIKGAYQPQILPQPENGVSITGSANLVICVYSNSYFHETFSDWFVKSGQ